MGNQQSSADREGDLGFDIVHEDPKQKEEADRQQTLEKELADCRPKGEGRLGACEKLLHEIDQPDLSYDPTAAWVQLESTQTFVEPQTKKGRTVPNSDAYDASATDATGAAAVNAASAATTDVVTDAATSGRLRFVCISDTHGSHRGTHLPRGDVLVHTGDFTNAGETHQVQDFCEWLVEQKKLKGFRHAIVIAGNHDVTLEPAYYTRIGAKRFHQYRPSGAFDCDKTRAILKEKFSHEITYLEDELVVIPNGTAQGCRIWGSPWQPEFNDWAFNLERGPPMREVCNRIPDDVDVLLTHGPPLGRGDKCKGGGHRVGCVDLLRTIQMRVQPRVHVFGHVHEGAGITHDGHTAYVNASTMTFQYRATNSSVTFDLDVVAADGSLKPPAVFVETSVSEWDAEKVKSWLDSKLEQAVAFTEAAAAAEAVETAKATEERVDASAPHSPKAPKSREPPSIWENAAVAADVAVALEGLDGTELCALNAGSLGALIGDFEALRPIKVQSGILRAIHEVEVEYT